jgi:heme/copper-type cytochrome/quinol oxidase subunit 3
MESLLIAWRFFLLTSIFAFPQLLGMLLYFRLRRLPRWAASIASALAPGILFFWLAPILLFSGIREAYARGEVRCGMPAMAALLVLFAGTIIQLVLGVITQVALYQRTK